ncbi:hypothetical protein CB1_002341013 [Camelus ferus]|nr:hypothetical protein CB1_002341013 [Camelus ferus]
MAKVRSRVEDLRFLALALSLSLASATALAITSSHREGQSHSLNGLPDSNLIPSEIVFPPTEPFLEASSQGRHLLSEQECNNTQPTLWAFFNEFWSLVDDNIESACPGYLSAASLSNSCPLVVSQMATAAALSCPVAGLWKALLMKKQNDKCGRDVQRALFIGQKP